MVKHTCGVPNCGVEFTKGGLAGRGGVKPMCPKHYHRARRTGSTAAKVPAVTRSFSIPLDVSSRLDAVLEHDANFTASSIVSKALAEWIDRHERRAARDVGPVER